MLLDEVNLVSDNMLRSFIREIVPLQDLALEVRKNYAENRWWPTTITDWRLRVVLAGWTTRVSYNSIHHYQVVVENARKIGFDALLRMSDSEITQITQGIGLSAARVSYLRSVSIFLASAGVESLILKGNTENAIEAFASSVYGAGYKVAQCAILYARGYHCGIIPVDSGMCEMLAPVIPAPYAFSGKGHEVVRHRLECFAIRNEKFLREQAAHSLYAWLELPASVPTWWLHLLIIYYKRLYWNRGISNLFPKSGKYSNLLTSNTNNIDSAKYPFVVIEGCDGSGKSTMASFLSSAGYVIRHSPLTKDSDKLSDLYSSIICHLSDPVVFDRFFLSELVYGHTLRAGSRISSTEADKLLEMMRQRGFIVFIISEKLKTIQERRPNDQSLGKLLKAYRHLYENIKTKVPTYWLESYSLCPAFFPRYFETV